MNSWAKNDVFEAQNSKITNRFRKKVETKDSSNFDKITNFLFGEIHTNIQRFETPIYGNFPSFSDFLLILIDLMDEYSKFDGIKWTLTTHSQACYANLTQVFRSLKTLVLPRLWCLVIHALKGKTHTPQRRYYDAVYTLLNLWNASNFWFPKLSEIWFAKKMKLFIIDYMKNSLPFSKLSFQSIHFPENCKNQRFCENSKLENVLCCFFLVLSLMFTRFLKDASNLIKNSRKRRSYNF